MKEKKPMSAWKYHREEHSIFKRFKAGFIGRKEYYDELEDLRRRYGKV